MGKDRNKMLYASMFAISLWLTSCANEPTPVAATTTPTITPPPTEFTPTLENPTQTLTPEDRFKLGPYDFAKTPFNIVAENDLRKLLGHVFGSAKYSGNMPLPVIRLDDGQDYSAFTQASAERPNGNPYLVFLTDQPNHLVFYFHSMNFFNPSPGELSRETVGWAHKNPDKIDELYQQKITLEINGSTIETDIVNANFISSDLWMGDKEPTPWSTNLDGDNVDFLQTKILGIPEEIRTDSSPNTFYITIVSCLNANPGEISVETPKKDGVPAITEAQAYYLNTANRSILTLRVTLP